MGRARNSEAMTLTAEQLDLLAVKMEELAELCPPVENTGCAQTIRDSTAQLAAMPEYLAPKVAKSLPKLADLIDEAKAVLLKNALHLLQKPTPTPKRAICEPEPCPSGPSQGTIDDLLIAAAAIQISATIAQGVADAIPEPFNAYAVAIATGLSVTVDTLNLTAAVLTKSLNEVTACEEASFQQVFYNICNATNQILESLDSLHNKVDLLDRKIDILLSLVAELQALTQEIMLREIEEDLKGCRTLTSLYLPAVTGGRLDTIAKLVQTLINSSIAASLNTGAAESYLKQGLSAALNKSYCEALIWFSQAYRQLISAACCNVEVISTRKPEQ